MVIISLLSPYVDWRKNACEKGQKYTLEDFANSINELYASISFIPIFNLVTTVCSAYYFTIHPIWEKIKHIRIV